MMTFGDFVDNVFNPVVEDALREGRLDDAIAVCVAQGVVFEGKIGDAVHDRMAVLLSGEK